MEQAQYWLWMKRKQLLKSQLQASMNSISTGSWEEKAFAEDHASGHLGGCIWPPRSYSCSFCKREFRSAQALGGHMNVHRRDRARLKQSLSPHDDVFIPQNHIQSSLQSLESHFSSDQVCTLDNYDLDHPKVSVPRTSNTQSTLSSSRVSDLSTQENSIDHALVTRFSSSFAPEQHKGRYPYLHNNLSGSDHSLAISFHSKPEAEKNQGEVDSTCLSHDNFVATDLFIGLGSVINSQSSSSPGYCGNEAIGCKRPKTNVSVLSLLIKPRPNNRCILQSEATGPNSSTKEDIDLELRLGDPSKVKY